MKNANDYGFLLRSNGSKLNTVDQNESDSLKLKQEQSNNELPL